MWMNVAAAYDPLDPNGNITIKWDVMSWTPDGYVVSFLSLKKLNPLSEAFLCPIQPIKFRF